MSNIYIYTTTVPEALLTVQSCLLWHSLSHLSDFSKEILQWVEYNTHCYASKIA